ncbi:MAG: lipid-A-disaccharide synthase, partial [Deltaproteobacteria bacterium]|nr:lipid-A-disaccharide synthase [Deltaproteobacteria bacterium]
AVGGDALRAAGAEVAVRYETISGMGLLEAAGRLPAVLAARKRVVELFERDPPRIFVPVDFGGLNLRLARAARARGIPVVYYIPPKVWAWGPWRVKKLREAVDEALVILPFEEAFFRERGVAATYVGSPVLDHLGERGFSAEPDTVGLLPGSRVGEVSRIWPLLVEASRLLLVSSGRPLRFLVPVAPGIDRGPLEESARGAGLAVELLDGRGQEVMERSRLCLVASGTATLECAAVGTPMVVVYRINALTHFLARRLVTVPFAALPNLIAGRCVVPEVLQTGPQEIARAALPLLAEGGPRAAMERGLAEVRSALGERGASLRAARRLAERLGPEVLA